MSKIWLLGHTGSKNRGCEAIVRSTVLCLNNAGITDINLASADIEYDLKLKLDDCAKIYPWRIGTPYTIKKILGKTLRKLFGAYMLNEAANQSNIIKRIQKDDIVLAIGGDTYCYGRPTMNYALNRYAKKKGAKTVFWGCSVEKESIDKEMKKDLCLYDLIFAREVLTYNALIESGVPKEKVFQIADPAFSLKTKENKLSEEYAKDKNIIGVNVSNIITRNAAAREGVLQFLKYILDTTDFNILFIPHVYDGHKIDFETMFELLKELNSERVSIVDEMLSCEEVKAIIAKCRLFIGARTHATIAAYSSYVPTLVLGYSVKSKGIATDLFGTTKNFAVMVEEAGDKELLIEAFEYLKKNEKEIRNRLIEVIPEYKNTTQNAIYEILRLGNII